MFDLNLKSTADWIASRKYNSVAIQLPEGLKADALRISDELHASTGANILIIGAPCYGACDVFTNFKDVADALVHFGHSSIPCLSNDEDVRFVEVRVDVDIGLVLKAILERLPERIGLLATVQYVGLLPTTKEILERSGRKVFVGRGDRRISYPGQVLGCNFSAAGSIEGDVDAFLYIGEGDFHPLAASFGIRKKMLVLNPITGELRSMDETRDRILRKRFATIEKARSAGSFLIIICGKIGQNRADEADIMMETLRKAGKQAYKVILDEISPDVLLPYRVDAYINTACPRIAMDDSARYSKPMLTLVEAEIVLGIREWDNYEFDSITNP